MSPAPPAHRTVVWPTLRYRDADRAIRDEEYGSRELSVRDPEGVFWSFGTWPGAAFAAHS
ncbi:MAG: hypothetical protein WCB85_09765 [Candidatus Dormiibacterota bacterium]